MSPGQRYIPLDAPLLAGEAHPQCKACVIVPARNEAEHLAETLDALRMQRDLYGDVLHPDTYEVILLLNNCTDRSIAVAEGYAAEHPEFHLHVVTRTLPPEQAHVGVARRLLMDTACARLERRTAGVCAILSTDGDTRVAPDWVASNLRAIAAGADVVGGVIHLFPADLDRLEQSAEGTFTAYTRDRELQRMTARLESLLDPDPADPWPRHLEHFGASLACTPAIYRLSGGLPPIRPLEDVAFIDALRKVGARIRHCPETHIFTSARLDGRAEVGLSGQLRIWREEAAAGVPHRVDSAEWLAHRFRSLEALRVFHGSSALPDLTPYPPVWHERLVTLRGERLAMPRFLELLDCNGLIEAMFVPMGVPRHDEITRVLRGLREAIAHAESGVLVSA